MKLQKILSVFILACNTLFGHALWIETNTSGKNGQAQEVKVFLGEYAANERDSTQNWFSNMRDFSLFLIAPDGKKSQLTTTASGNHFKASFTPSIAGTYVLSIDHLVTEVYGGSKIHYYALAQVTVNGSTPGSNNLAANAAFGVLANATVKYKVNSAEKVQLLYKKNAVKTGSLAVQSPEGWAKTFKADANGIVSFVPFWVGLYLLEGTFTEEESGVHEGKDYKRVWHCTTYCLPVEK